MEINLLMQGVQKKIQDGKSLDIQKMHEGQEFGKVMEDIVSPTEAPHLVLPGNEILELINSQLGTSGLVGFYTLEQGSLQWYGPPLMFIEGCTTAEGSSIEGAAYPMLGSVGCEATAPVEEEGAVIKSTLGNNQKTAGGEVHPLSIQETTGKTGNTQNPGSSQTAASIANEQQVPLETIVGLSGKGNADKGSGLLDTALSKTMKTGINPVNQAPVENGSSNQPALSLEGEGSGNRNGQGITSFLQGFGNSTPKENLADLNERSASLNMPLPSSSADSSRQISPVLNTPEPLSSEGSPSLLEAPGTKGADNPLSGSETSRVDPGLSSFAREISEKHCIQDLQTHIMDQIRINVNKANNQARIFLHPPELGHIQINLSMEGNRLTVHIEAREALVSHLLEQDIQQLKNTLSSAGIEVDEFDIRSKNNRQQAEKGADSSRSKFEGPGEEDGEDDEKSNHSPVHQGPVRLSESPDGVDYLV